MCRNSLRLGTMLSPSGAAQSMTMSVLDPSLAAALRRASDGCGELLRPLTSQAVVVPVLTADAAASVASELRAVAPCDMYDLASEEHFRVAQSVVEVLENVVMPILALQLDPRGRQICALRRTYALRYANDGQAMPDRGRTRRVHVDDCDVTLAICLDGEWQGADLVYVEPPADGRPRPRTPDPSDPAVNVVRHTHQCGVGVLHSGEAYHFVDELSAGERFTLVVQAMWDDGAAWKRTFLQRSGPAQPPSATTEPAAEPELPEGGGSTSEDGSSASAASLLRWSQDTSAPRAEIEAALASESLSNLGALLQRSGRPAVLGRLKALGISQLGDRQKLCNALSRGVREGALNRAGELPPDFAAAAERMPGYARRILLDGNGGESGESGSEQAALLIAALKASARGVTDDRAAPTPQTTARVDSAAPALRRPGSEMLREEHALSEGACRALRDAVDARRSVLKDSVDKAAEHQLNLSVAELTALIGDDETQTLLALPARLKPSSDAPLPAFRVEIFVRRYSRSTRPWIQFHCDNALFTVNVACAPDARHEGGRLVCVVDDELQQLERDEGEATVHPSSLLHAVTSMTTGVRYSLICFFHRKEEVEVQ